MVNWMDENVWYWFKVESGCVDEGVDLEEWEIKMMGWCCYSYFYCFIEVGEIDDLEKRVVV